MIDELASYLLPGVPVERVAAALGSAAGQELASGKFGSRQSSAALAVNGFGYFLEYPTGLPAFPSLSDLDWAALSVEIERQMRFPWSGGRHPWLDAAVETETHLIGVESKRFEPFRDSKQAKLSSKYSSHRWSEAMEPWCAMRDLLLSEPSAFRHLDAAQLVKHGYGLVTEARRRGKQPALLYLYAEPTEGRVIPAEAFSAHRSEIARFAQGVAGSTVRFAACSWREWLATFPSEFFGHADRIIAQFHS
ncbi:hypothetical protein GGR44_000788 [Sphingobium fontiphilum]|uniref:Uncharacterized protein n=1 Tax=Sphingobium fontiphilum TaxID=944425 RepID=A0A7W6DEC6_9SPHN|nr:hypothetical protein [Sphingobium fontiphilum]MBB3981157.1 hypothetical protein [Sphingobium fontiphilum]